MKSAALAAVLLAATTPTSVAPESVPRVVIFPKSIAIGSAGAIEVQVEMPMMGGRPTLRALAGALDAPKLDEGLWVAKYRPPSIKGPAFDPILATSAAGATGMVAVRLVAKTTIPIAVKKAGASVTVHVGERDFGPVTAAAGAETVDVPVEVPPGVDEVGVTTTTPDGASVDSKEKLALPPLRRLFVQAPPSAKQGKAFEVLVIALGKDGAPLALTPVIQPRGGKVKALASIGPGVWNAQVAGDGGPMSLLVLCGGAKSRVTVIVSGAPPAPSATSAPSATATPEPVAAATPPPDVPPAPSCAQLQLEPGRITTSAQLRKEIDTAVRDADLVRRRDTLIALGCAFPDESAITVQLTADELLLGDNQAALDVVTPLLSDEGAGDSDEIRALALSYRASAELRLGELEAAMDDARAAESLLPGLYSATYTLGEAAFLAKDFAGASAALLSAYKSAPEYATSTDHVMLAELLETRNDLEEAALHRYEAARLEPNDLDAWRKAAHEADAAHVYTRAYIAWRMLVASTMPGTGANTEAAVAAARDAQFAPKDPAIALVESALDAETRGGAAKGIPFLDKALAADPRNLAARWHAARMLHAAGNDDRARQEVGRLLDMAPHWTPALILSGDLERPRDPAKALARYQEALASGAPMSTVAKWRIDELLR